MIFKMQFLQWRQFKAFGGGALKAGEPGRRRRLDAGAGFSAP
jgi:hypothetical protein